MYNLSSKNKKLLIVFLFIFIIISSLSLIQTEYYFMSPGPPYQWDIDYGEIENYEFDGSLYQLTVRRDEANVLIYFWSLINDSYDLYPRDVILPDGVTPKELSEISIQNMRTSENAFSEVLIFWILISLNSFGVTPSGKITSRGYKS